MLSRFIGAFVVHYYLICCLLSLCYLTLPYVSPSHLIFVAYLILPDIILPYLISFIEFHLIVCSTVLCYSKNCRLSYS